MRFVVSGLEHREGFHETGGNLLDIAVDNGPDHLDGMSTWFEQVFPRQAAYDRVEVDGDALIVSGRDSRDPAVTASTRWELVPPPPGALASLRISTTVTASEARPEFDLGDIIGWGGLRHFAPGRGYALAGSKDTLPWLGAENQDHALLLVAEAPFAGPHGSAWSDPIYASPDLAPGTPYTYVRTLHVGQTLAGMVGAAVDGREVTVIAHDDTGDAIPHARFRVEQDGRPFSVGRVDGSGRARVVIPPGPAVVTLEEWGRNAEGAALAADAEEVTATASSVGAVAATVEGPDGAIPARLLFLGLDGRPAPVLGPDHHAIGGNRANLAGPGTVQVPPGTWEVVATRGPAWSIARQHLVVTAGATVPLRMRLEPLLDTEGWLQCDLHQHAVYSADSAVPPVDGVIASAAEGLDCIATTDHDAVADWTQHIEAADLAAPMLWMSGIEVTTHEDGHYNVYPHPPERGVIEKRGLQPAGIAAAIRAASPDAILQVNHPRAGGIGAFNKLGGPAEVAAFDHDAVEVLNGDHLGNAEELLDDVARMRGAGTVTSIVGASDSHRLVGQERGTARTFVRSELRQGAAVDAIKAGRTVASNGPLVWLEAKEGTLQVHLRASGWVPVDAVALYGGPLGTEREDLGEPLQRWTVQPDTTLRSLDAQHEARPGWWYLAVARGEQTMQPWLPVKPWAATGLVVKE